MNELLVSRLKSARMDKGLKQQDVAERLGIKANTISNWEKGRTEPDIDTFIKLCDIYQIDCASLLSDVYAFERIGEEITLSEYDYIKKYRNLDDIGKQHIDTVLSWELERINGMNSPKSTPIIPMPTRIVNYYQRLASAGTGQILWDDIPANEIEIPDNKETKNVDFALGVNGDSMEPVYWDSDIVLVEKTTDLEIGEIGVFEVDGECFIKELGDHELISFNRQYTPKPIYDTTQFYCIGRVVGNLMEHSSSDIAYLIRRRGALKRYQSMYPMAAEKGIDDSVESQEMVKRMIEEANTLRE
jgi:transcriptional regulator with XRE-family HTH domain